MTEFEFGWLIGILEGEGSFSSYEYKHRRVRNGVVSHFDDFTSMMRVVSTDQAVVDRLRILTGLGQVKPKKLNSPLSKKEQFEWRVDKRPELRKFLPLIHPHLSARRQEQIDKMMFQLGLVF